MKTQTKILAAIIALTAVSGPAISFAQDDLLQQAQTVLNSEQIDVDADYEEPAEKSAQELLEDARKKSEMDNVKKIANKISKLKVSKQQVKEITLKEGENLSSRINSIFGTGSDSKSESKDTVSTKQAAPQKETQIVVIQAPQPKSSLAENVRVIPSVGVTNIQGEGINLESKYSVGLDVETMVTERIAIGVGVGYSTLELLDISDNWRSNPYYYDYSELKYNQLELRLNSKLFLTTNSRFRPYIGVGVAYNRVNMKYTGEENNDYNSSSWYYGTTTNKLPVEEEFTSGYVSGNVSLGAEVKITKNIGLAIEGRYSRGLTGGIANETVINSDRQARLDRLGEAITDSDFLSLNGGLLVTF